MHSAYVALAIFLAATAVCAADDDLDKQFEKLRSSIPFKAFEEKYANGQIKERGHMRFLGYVCGTAWTEYDGLREGWYASGAKECEIWYKNADRDGLALNWFPNGKKKYSVEWKRGKRDGNFTVFYDSEAVSAKGRFSDETVVEAEFFDRAGKRIPQDRWLEIPGNRSFWN
jgi:MORN repeat variant